MSATGGGDDGLHLIQRHIAAQHFILNDEGRRAIEDSASIRSGAESHREEELLRYMRDAVQASDDSPESILTAETMRCDNIQIESKVEPFSLRSIVTG